MATKRGLFAGDDYEAGIKKLDVRDMIFQLEPDAAPFVTCISKMSKKKAVDTEFKWFEDSLMANYSQVNAGGGFSDTDTVLILDSVSSFQVGDVVKNLTSNECMLINAVDDTAETITVTRAWGTTSAASMADDEYIYRLGSAQPEGYTIPDSLVTVKTPKTNYLQIFSKAVKITKTAEAIDTYGGNRRAYEQRKKGVEYKREMESQFFWGEPKEDTSGSEPRRQTGGIYYFLGATSPTLDMSSAALTESAFEGWLKDVFTYDEGDRYLFTGPLVLSQISQFASGKQRMTPGKDKTYGISVVKYISALGVINMVLDRHFIGPHAGKGLALKMDEIVYRYLQGQDMTLHLNQQPNNVKYKLDEYEATIGLEIHHSLKHGILKGVA